MKTRTVPADEDHIVLVLTPREAVALRGYLSVGPTPGEFTGRAEAQAFGRVREKLFKACPWTLWTRFDFEWWDEYDRENYPEIYGERCDQFADWYEEGEDL